MIEKKTEILKASCDSCGRSLLKDVGDGHRNANYGDIKPSFGYGSDLDTAGATLVPHYHLCEGCFTKALHAVGLPVDDFDPAVCPVCRGARAGADDHPECMKKWPPHATFEGNA